MVSEQVFHAAVILRHDNLRRYVSVHMHDVYVLGIPKVPQSPQSLFCCCCPYNQVQQPVAVPLPLRLPVPSTLSLTLLLTLTLASLTLPLTLPLAAACFPRGRKTGKKWHRQQPYSCWRLACWLLP
jgi:hypothetical protein